MQHKRDIEHPNFDMKYQEAVLHLCLTDNDFAKALVIYLTPEKGKRKLNAFTNSHFQTIFNCITDSINEYDKIPSEGHINNYIDERFEGEESELIKKVAGRLLVYQVPDPEYYRANISDYVIAVKIANGIRDFQQKVEEAGSIIAGKNVLREIADEVDRVDLEESAFQTLGSLVDEFENKDLPAPEYIKTGIPDLDMILNGGMPKGALAIFLGPNNVGKTTTIIDLCGCAPILQGKKVLHVPLDGKLSEARNRYISNLCDIPVQRINKRNLNDYEKNKIREITKKLDQQLLIYNMNDYSPKVERLITKLESIKKTFNFDVVIIDYIGCLGTIEKTNSVREVNQNTHRAIAKFSQKNQVLCVSAAQATRDGQKRLNGSDAMRDKSGNYILRSTDIAESDDIGRVAEIIITLNRTDQEVTEERLRLYLEKQREGKKGVLFGLHTNYSVSRINTGKYYDPNIVVGAEEMFADDSAKPQDGKEKVFSERDREQLKKRCSTLINEKRSLQEQVDVYTKKIQESQDEAERQNYSEYREKIQVRVNEIVANIKKHAALMFPGASPELLNQMQDQYADMEKNSSISKLDLAKAKLDLTILKYLFDIVK